MTRLRMGKYYKIFVTLLLSVGELLFFSSIVLPLKIQKWKMANIQRKCGNDSVVSVQISQKSEEESGMIQFFKNTNFFAFHKISLLQNSIASSKHIFKMKEVFVICMSNFSAIHTISL